MPWRFDSTDIETLVEEKAYWNKLMLKFRVTKSTYDAKLAEVEKNAGKASAFVDSKGKFTGRDRSGGDNTYSLSPPLGRDPPRRSGDYICSKFKRQQLDRQGDRYMVTTEWLRPESKTLRDESLYINETAGSTEWWFIFDRGEMATSRVSAKIRGKNQAQLTEAELEVVMDIDQTTLFEEHCSRLANVHEVNYPDAKNESIDETPESRNSVYVKPPDTGSAFTEGYYRVSEWTTHWTNDKHYRVKMKLLDADTGKEVRLNANALEGTLA